MSDDSRELSRMEDILSGEDYLPKKPMSRIEELLLDGAMVPKVDSTDNGKVLKVIDGEWKPGEDVSGDNLPPVSSLDNGKVLKVVSGEWNIGSDKSDIVMVQMGVSYASFKDSSQVTLPANIKSVLLANYYNNPPVPTYLITTDSVIFQPIEVNKSAGTTQMVQIRWGRFYSYLDTVTHESNVYNDSIIYNTQDNDTIARFSKSAALQTIPPVDSTDANKVMQVGNDGTWQANDLPTYDDVPPVAAGNVGMYLKATATGEYGWASIPKDALFLSFDFLGGQISLPTNLGITMANSNAPIFLKNASIGKSDYGKIFYPVSRDYTITLGVVENASWECVSVETVSGKDITYIEKIIYNMDADNHDETATYSKAELKAGGGVAVPPVIFDDGNLKKMEISGFPGIEKVYLTPTAYSNLTTTQKEDLSKIYYVSDYEFHVDPDHPEVVVRVGSNNEVRWFFSGYTFANNNRYEVPESLQQYQPNNGTGRVRVDSTPYASASSTEPINQNYFVGWSNLDQVNKVRYSSITGSVSILNGTVYAVIDPNGSSAQTNPYSDPFDVPNGFTIYYGNKQYTDFDIPDPLPAVTSLDEGKVLKVNSSGEWAAGNEDSGLEVVKLSQTAYDSLTDAQKKNGKMYLIDASIFTGGIPRVSGADSKITASSQNGSGSTYQAWLAFDGVDHTPDTDNDGWVPNNGDDQWIKYQFASATPINKIMFKAVSRNVTTWSGTIYIEGSNDDTTWENILSTKQSITTELPARSSRSVEFNEDANGKSYTYIRLRINNQVYQRFMLSEFDADITTLTYDSIYYMDRQYSTMYEPVPEVTMADAGKALIVNSEGEWDKGDIREVPAIHLGDNEKILTVESGEASWSSPKKVTHLYDEIPISDPLYFLGNIDPSTSPLTIDMTQYATNYEELRSTDFEFVFMGGESNLIKRPWGYNAINSAPGTFSYNPVTGELTATLYGGFSSETSIGIVYKKAIIQLNENAVITGQSGTIDCTDVPNADILTVADFGIVLTNVNEPSTSNTGTLQIAASMSYNQTTKQLSWSVNATSYQHLQASGYVVVGNYGDPEYRLITNFVGATGSSDGYRGYVPSPVSADKDKFLKGDGTWNPVYREITQADYDLLPASKNSDGIIYFITDNS